MGIFILFMIREIIVRSLSVIHDGLKAYAHMRRSMHIAAYVVVVIIEFGTVMFIHDEMAHYTILAAVLTHEGIPLAFAE